VTRGAAATGTEAPTDAFRAACAQFATGVTVVTTSTPEGDFGVTVNSFTSLSLEPPQVIVCLARTSNTWEGIERAGVFAVNVLAADQLSLARLFATKRPDKFSPAQAGTDGGRPPEVRIHQGTVGAPLLDGALATLECRLVEAFPSGTHTIIVGRVVRVDHDPARGPALFFRSRLYGGFEDAVAPGASERRPTHRDQ
jgi:flavin reductase (DIM6/NTAB) family NADH-FMN oxidoreductase RutF